MTSRSCLPSDGAAFLLLTQSEGKLEKLYSKLDRSSIEANFGNIFLGCTQDVEALKYYPLFFGKYEKEKKSTSSGSSGDGRNSSVTISTQKEEIYESKDFASLEPGEFIGMGNRSNIKGISGTNHKRLVPVVILLGAIFLIWADVLARVLVKNAGFL